MILPCFIFSQIITNFKISQYNLIFQAFTGCIFLYGLGFFLGFFIMKILGYNKSQCYFLGAIYSSPHTTSIPVILFSTIGPVLDKVIPMPASFPVKCQQRGYLYIILNSIFSNIWKWSVGYYFIQPEESTYTNTNAKNNETLTIKKFIKEIMTAPLISSIISIGIASFPKVQQALIKRDGFLFNSFMVANTLVGKTYSFFVMLTLGLALCESIFPETDKKNIKEKVFFRNYDLIISSLGKLLVMPIFSWPLLIILCRNIIFADDVLLFLFLFMGMAPGAINMIMICTLKGYYQESVSVLMVAMYGISIITLTLGVTGIISLIGYLNNIVIS